MPDYCLELPNSTPIMVRANNKAQAIRFATHRLVKVEILTTEIAIKLAKAGQELLDATGEPEAEPSAPLLENQSEVGDQDGANGVAEDAKGEAQDLAEREAEEEAETDLLPVGPPDHEIVKPSRGRAGK